MYSISIRRTKSTLMALIPWQPKKNSQKTQMSTTNIDLNELKTAPYSFNSFIS